TNTSQNQEPRRCYYCGRTGHLIAKCRTRQAKQKSRDDRRDDRRDNYRRDDYRRDDYKRDERRRSHSRSRDCSYRSSSRDKRNSRENSQERSRYSDFYNNDSRRASFRSPSPYRRDINYLGHNSTPPSAFPVPSNNKWEHFLDNPSICIAMPAYLYKKAKKTDLLPTSHTTPIKCNIRLRNRPYQAIIDSGAAI
ncbi:3148_t:CDS:1, partial [Dentiscutata erythropus]